MYSPPKCDVIIPARNEEATIASIVQMWNHSGRACHIYVAIDTYTTDRTLSRVWGWGAEVLTPPNAGKGELVTAALQKAHTKRIVFCDADYHLDINHIHEIIYYCGWLTEDCDTMRIGVPQPVGQWPGWVGAQAAYPFVSGLRSVPLELVQDLKLYGYLMETQINQAAEKAGIKTEFKEMGHIEAPLRFTDQRLAEMQRDRKRGIAKGILEY